jgi:hypothetical protein
MSGRWSIIVPEATTNLITNPSFETNVAGWAVSAGGTVARSALYSVFGLYSLAVTLDADANDGINTSFAATNGVTYTFSIYVKGVNAIPYRLVFANAAWTHVSGYRDFTGDGEWHRYELTYKAVATETLFVWLVKNNNASTGTFYIDAAQVEAKAYATTYCDGSIDPPREFYSSGCTWSGVSHASTSSRSGTSRAGGLEKNLEDEYGFIEIDDVGTGAPTLKILTTPYIALDGDFYDNTRIEGRVFTILGAIHGTSLANYQALRNELIDALFANAAREPVLIRYDGGERKIEIAAHYAAGLEGGESVNFIEKLALRFVAPYPYWREVIE